MRISNSTMGAPVAKVALAREIIGSSVVDPATRTLPVTSG